MKKKLISIVLTVCIALTMMPATVRADGLTPRAEALDLTSASVSYSGNSGTSAADPAATNITDTNEGWTWYCVESGGYAAKTLVLSGLTLNTTAATALKVPDGTTIVLAEGTTSTLRSGDISTDSEDAYAYCINAVGDLAIKGSGTLNATAGTAEQNTSGKHHYGCGSAGIYSSGTLTITGSVKVTAIGGNSSGGAEGSASIGLYSEGDLIINSGSITGEGADANASVGIGSEEDLVITGGVVTGIGEFAAIYGAESLTVGSDTLPAAISNATDGTNAITTGSGIIASQMLIMSGSSAVTIRFPLTAAVYAAASPAAAPGTDYVLDTDNKVLTIKTAKGAAFWSASGTDYLDYTVKLANDVNVSDFLWTPVGTDFSQRFIGTFNGQGHTISGLTVDVSSNSGAVYAGLFGVVSIGTVENVTVSGSVSAVSTNTVYAGGIAGSITGQNDDVLSCLKNCVSNVTVTAEVNNSASSYKYAYAGGLAGKHTATHTINCGSTGAVTASSNSANGRAYAGGLAGRVNAAQDSCVNNSYNTGAVSAAAAGTSGTAYAGGISGLLEVDSLRKSAGPKPQRSSSGFCRRRNWWI